MIVSARTRKNRLIRHYHYMTNCLKDIDRAIEVAETAPYHLWVDDVINPSKPNAIRTERKDTPAFGFEDLMTDVDRISLLSLFQLFGGCYNHHFTSHFQPPNKWKREERYPPALKNKDGKWEPGPIVRDKIIGHKCHCQVPNFPHYFLWPGSHLQSSSVTRNPLRNGQERKRKVCAHFLVNFLTDEDWVPHAFGNTAFDSRSFPETDNCGCSFMLL